ncbi:unnamed protein product [marine sediment metagenome]|uniref:Uncharacterized protein n=1 Tax=marine sediment metagenome TaxID=412755 RepID=X1UJT7_9ZZZZ
MSRTNQILITVSVIIFSISPSFGDWKENAKAIDISGGENHTLVLTKNKTTWACGPNGSYQYPTYYGVLGTGSTDPGLIAKTLIRVLAGDMGNQYLQDINDVDAG